MAALTIGLALGLTVYLSVGTAFVWFDLVEAALTGDEITLRGLARSLLVMPAAALFEILRGGR